MKMRDRKRRISAEYLLCGKTIGFNGEGRAGLDMGPIGREFGSKDYERFEVVDAFTDRRQNAQKTLRLLGVDHDASVAMAGNEDLPKQFVSNVLQSVAEVDAGMLEPYLFSNSALNNEAVQHGDGIPADEVIAKIEARFEAARAQNWLEA